MARVREDQAPLIGIHFNYLVQVLMLCPYVFDMVRSKETMRIVRCTHSAVPPGLGLISG